MTTFQDSHREFTISELAEETGVSVRNIRSYRNHGLLPAPKKRGRNGIYSAFHASRLRIITELLGRGYSIANIEELFKTMQAGQSIDSLLGLENAVLTPIRAETSKLYSFADLKKMFGQSLTLRQVHRAIRLGLLQIKGTQFLAPRQTMIHIGSELIKQGIPLDNLLDIDEGMRNQLDLVSATIIDIIYNDLFGTNRRSMPNEKEAKVLTEKVWKMRGLIDEAVLSELGQSLNSELRRRFGDHLSHVFENR